MYAGADLTHDAVKCLGPKRTPVDAVVVGWIGTVALLTVPNLVDIAPVETDIVHDAQD